MEKKKFDLCVEILRRLAEARILDGMILVGSWCVVLYQDYFHRRGNLPPIRTRDIEFLIPIPPRFSGKTDLQELIGDLGFVPDHKGEQGHVVFLHPDLILEFLVPQRGRGSEKPYPVAQL